MLVLAAEREKGTWRLGAEHAAYFHDLRKQLTEYPKVRIPSDPQSRCRALVAFFSFSFEDR